MLMWCHRQISHYSDVKMGAMASQITSLTIVYSTVYSGADQRKHQSSASLAFVWGIHRSPVNSPYKWPVTRKMFPFNDVIMQKQQARKVHVYCYIRNLISFILCYIRYVSRELLSVRYVTQPCIVYIYCHISYSFYIDIELFLYAYIDLNLVNEPSRLCEKMWRGVTEPISPVPLFI